jgi:hypothetical protein
VQEERAETGKASEKGRQSEKAEKLLSLDQDAQK